MKPNNSTVLPARDLMRATNRINVLHAIRTLGSVSRSELAKTTGLSNSSITGLTSELIEEGLLVEKASSDPEGGRPPILLSLKPSGAYVVGVNLAIDKISSMVIDLTAAVLTQHELPLGHKHYEVEEIIDLITQSVHACIWEANLSKDQISGVGLGVPGLVNHRTGNIQFLPNYAWRNVDLRSRVEEVLQRPTYLENSSNTLALAEHWFGVCKGVRDFMVVTIENGVGLGIFAEEKLYRGHDGFAAEFGHLTLDPEGPQCRCGRSGCIESYVGIISAINAARKLHQQGEWKLEKDTVIDYDLVLAGAQKKIPALAGIFTRAGEALAMGVSHLIKLFDPSRIIITGHGVQAGDLLFDPFYQKLPEFLSGEFHWDLSRILIRQWTDLDWARGAGALVLQELFKTPLGYADLEKTAFRQKTGPAKQKKKNEPPRKRLRLHGKHDPQKESAK